MINNKLKCHIKAILSIIRTPFHSGNRYECPLCGFRSKDLPWVGDDTETTAKYQIIGMGKRRGGCWKCGAKDKEKSVFLYLSDILNLFEPPYLWKKVLHIAPEKGIAEHIMKTGIDYICGDYFMDGYFYPPYVRKMDIRCLPYPDNKFDLIICNHVLEHVENDRKAMSELYRVLTKGGKAILQAPVSLLLPVTMENPGLASPTERLKYFGQKDHVRIYGADYVYRLTEAGFNVETFLFPDSVTEKYGLIKNEQIYVCSKS